MHVFYNTCKAINNTRIQKRNYLRSLSICPWSERFGSMTEKGYFTEQ